MGRRAVTFLGVLLALAAQTASAGVYLVGPGEKIEKVSEIAAELKPGDVVEVTGDIKDSFVLHNHGFHNAPIVIRGRIKVEDGQIIRPVITLNNRSSPGIVCLGNWNVLEGLEITRARGPASLTGTAIFVACENLLIRNCRLRDNFQGLYAEPRASGNVTIEFCEFLRNGASTRYHSVDLGANRPDARAIVQFCVFRDSNGGHFLKAHCPSNVIRYNWFESSYYSAVQIVDSRFFPGDDSKRPDSPLYPMHSDIVGNVFDMGRSPGGKYSVMQLGGEDENVAGTEGDFNIAHNLFVVSRGDDGVRGVSLLVHGNVDRVRAYNNVFMEYGVPGHSVYERGEFIWEGPRTAAFRERRGGSGEPLLEGANNWASLKSRSIPQGFLRTLRGASPRFVDMFNHDFRPKGGSPLDGAGVWPLPRGRLIDLVPAYEPQRGIPVDLKPTARRKAVPPSIGPFEVAE